MRLSKSILMKLIKEEINTLYEWGENPLEQSALHEEPNGEGMYKLFAPYDSEAYDTYDSLDKLKEDLEDIKKLAPDWEDWTVETPEGNMPAYEFDD